jgi:hypothetical protein
VCHHISNPVYVVSNGHPARVSVPSQTECFVTDESLIDVAIVVFRPTCPERSASALTYPDIAWTSSSMVDMFRRFTRTCYLHYQSGGSTLKLESADSSETWNYSYQATWCDMTGYQERDVSSSPGPPSFWCGAGNFCKIWSACRQHEIQYTELKWLNIRQIISVVLSAIRSLVRHGSNWFDLLSPLSQGKD